ncbi:MAG: hypothetical protein R3Y07_00115 [Eubacteriales bacterium]
MVSNGVDYTRGLQTPYDLAQTPQGKGYIFVDVDAKTPTTDLVTSSEMTRIMSDLLETSLAGSTATSCSFGYTSSYAYKDPLGYFAAAGIELNKYNYPMNANGTTMSSTYYPNYLPGEYYYAADSDYPNNLYVSGNTYYSAGRLLGAEVVVTSGGNELTNTGTPTLFDRNDWPLADMTDLDGIETDDGYADIIGVARNAGYSSTELKLVHPFLEGSVGQSLTVEELEAYIFTISQTTTDHNNDHIDAENDPDTIKNKSYIIVSDPFAADVQALLGDKAKVIISGAGDSDHLAVDALCKQIDQDFTFYCSDTTKRVLDEDVDLYIDDNEVNLYSIRVPRYYQTTVNYEPEEHEVWETIITTGAPFTRKKRPRLSYKSGNKTKISTVYMSISTICRMMWSDCVPWMSPPKPPPPQGSIPSTTPSTTPPSTEGGWVLTTIDCNTQSTSTEPPLRISPRQNPSSETPMSPKK